MTCELIERVALTTEESKCERTFLECCYSTPKPLSGSLTALDLAIRVVIERWLQQQRCITGVSSGGGDSGGKFNGSGGGNGGMMELPGRVDYGKWVAPVRCHARPQGRQSEQAAMVCFRWEAAPLPLLPRLRPCCRRGL